MKLTSKWQIAIIHAHHSQNQHVLPMILPTVGVVPAHMPQSENQNGGEVPQLQ